MGNELACFLPEGWDTQVKEVVNSALNTFEVFKLTTLQWLKDFALQFARCISITGDADFKQVVSKSMSSSLLSCITQPFTRGQFLTFCKDVVKGLLRRSENYKAVQELLCSVLMETLNSVCAVANCPVVREFFNNVLKNAREEMIAEVARTSARQQLAKAATETVAEELIENTTKLSRASKSGVQALKVGAIVDGCVWLGSVGYTYYRYRQNEIDKPTAQRTVIKRTGAAVGSIGLGAAGTFIGTMLLPGVGTFVGGFIGGFAGDYIGSQAGDKVARQTIQEHHDRQD